MVSINTLPSELLVICISYLNLYDSLTSVRGTSIQYKKKINTLFYNLCLTNYLKENDNVTIPQLLASNWWREPMASMSQMPVNQGLRQRLQSNNFITIKKMRYYRGELKNGKRHGNGEMKWENGFYRGTWKDDIRHGYGTMRVARGPVYSIEWDR